MKNFNEFGNLQQEGESVVFHADDRRVSFEELRPISGEAIEEVAEEHSEIIESMSSEKREFYSKILVRAKEVIDELTEGFDYDLNEKQLKVYLAHNISGLNGVHEIMAHESGEKSRVTRVAENMIDVDNFEKTVSLVVHEKIHNLSLLQEISQENGLHIHHNGLCVETYIPESIVTIPAKDVEILASLNRRGEKTDKSLEDISKVEGVQVPTGFDDMIAEAPMYSGFDDMFTTYDEVQGVSSIENVLDENKGQSNLTVGLDILIDMAHMKKADLFRLSTLSLEGGDIDMNWKERISQMTGLEIESIESLAKVIIQYEVIRPQELVEILDSQEGLIEDSQNTGDRGVQLENWVIETRGLALNEATVEFLSQYFVDYDRVAPGGPNEGDYVYQEWTGIWMECAYAMNSGDTQHFIQALKEAELYSDPSKIISFFRQRFGIAIEIDKLENMELTDLSDMIQKAYEEENQEELDRQAEIETIRKTLIN